jgi:hypothetical protein
VPPTPVPPTPVPPTPVPPTPIPPTPVPPTPIPPTLVPINSSISLTTDKQIYKPGDPQTICYRLTPQDIPFFFRLFESAAGGGFVPLYEGTDNGIGGGDCLGNFRVSQQAIIGAHQFRIEVFINNQLVAARNTNYTVEALASYSMHFDVEGSSFYPGDTIEFCYQLTPQNVPYQVRLLSNNAVVRTWSDNGVNGGDCSTVALSSEASPGQRTLRIEAIINNAVVASDSDTITVLQHY